MTITVGANFSLKTTEVDLHIAQCNIKASDMLSLVRRATCYWKRGNRLTPRGNIQLAGKNVVLTSKNDTTLRGAVVAAYRISKSGVVCN
ncbi:hemagglutinin repeat-containing protein [Xanthomonas campestris]|uniref:hemagglutinin repeat-containing protein n=1 Tax=Xanthomonas campestris TaxID=339 RepID=UPI000E1E6F34|nr:hemagglutinin repeat-containing protein [Xanthomonas campestris]